MSKSPSRRRAIAQFRAPCSRNRRVISRVSTSVMPIISCFTSQSVRDPLARWLDAGVIGSRSTHPSASGVGVSMSSRLTPVLPTCGKENVTICPA